MLVPQVPHVSAASATVPHLRNKVGSFIRARLAATWPVARANKDCMQDTLIARRTRPKGQARRATIEYLVYKNKGILHTFEFRKAPGS